MRERISKQIKDGLVERARDFNILADDVSIIHIGF